MIQANAMQIPLKDNSVQCVVTSPPYWGLRDYGNESTIWGDPTCEHEWGDKIEVNATNHTDKRRWNHTRNGRDEEQPVEKRVAWLRTPVAQGQFCRLCGAWFGCLGLEPTPELFVQHMVEVFREVRRVLKNDGTLWCNLGDSYNANQGAGFNANKRIDEQNRNTAMKRPDWLKPKDLVGIPWMVAFALRADGWWLRSDIIWSKPNPMPESVTDRPTKAHEYVFLMAKSERYYFDQDAVREAHQDQKGIDRFITSGGSRSDFIPGENQGFNGTGWKMKAGGREYNESGRNIRSVWTIATQPYPETHFATFPEDLIKPCILAGCPVGGVVLDPFAGSGTTVKVAQDLGRIGVGCELKTDYLQLGKKRSAQQGLRI